jgi:site-specific DNA-methyltransferase (adenine-specific)
MISEVHFIDNVEFMKTLPDNFIDLAYLDPEYGIGESKKNHKSRNTPIIQKNGNFLKAKDNIFTQEDWDISPPSDEYFNEVFRISKEQFIWGGNYFKQIVGTPFKPPRRKDFNKFLDKNPKGWVLWDKVNGTNDFNDCELAWTSFDRPSIILPYLWNGMMQGVSIQYGLIQKGNKKLNEKRIHPTQKPMPINKWVLMTYLSNKNSKVFDAGIGSQGSRIAAYEFGCDFYGCENNQHNFDSGQKRFKQFLDQHKNTYYLF